MARTDPEPETFGPGSMMWDSVGLHTYVLASNGAFVLQVMHPAIGAVVAKESVYLTDPIGRFQRSFASVQTWIYGGDEALAEGRRLREMHKDFRAVDDQGRSHHALSAEPWAWVPLTGMYAGVVGAKYFGPRPVTRAEQERSYEEVKQLCRILRVPERMIPPTLDEYWEYFDGMIADTLEDHPTAHSFLDMMDRGSPVPDATPAVLRPVARSVGLAAGKLNRFVAIGTLPQAARDKLGLTWTASDERRLVALGRAMYAATAPLPERMRYMPIAYKARQAARANQALGHALATRPM